MRGIAILLLIVVFFWIVWPSLARWLKKRAMMKAEDYIRTSMGMPPRDKKRKYYQKETRQNSSTRRSTDTYHRYGGQEPLIPKEYAEDVEFVETKNYSESMRSTQTSEKEENYHESQVSDAEWTEIKTSRTK